jgi:hypothetical protein
MNWSEWFLVVTGAIVIAFGAVCICVLAIGWLGEYFERTHGPSYEAGREFERYRLMSDSWWFSESPATTNLLQDLARDGASVYAVRERWRKARAEDESELRQDAEVTQ